MPAETTSPPEPDAGAPRSPAPTGGGAPIGGRTRAMLRALAADTWYLLATLPVAVASFVVLVTGATLAVGLVVVWLGIPVMLGTLTVAVAFGRLERMRLGARGTVLAPVVYAEPRGEGVRRLLHPLTDPRRWAALVHGVGALLLSVVTWSVTVSWWAVVAGGLTSWSWEQWLPDQEVHGLAELLHMPARDSVVNFVVGVVFAATAPKVMRALVAAHEAWARLLLTGSSRRALEGQVAALEQRGASAAAAETSALRRLERDLHDGPQQRLVRLGMDLAAAERRLEADPAEARRLLEEARVQTAETLAELRELSRGIAPPILTDRGLAAALAPVAARAAVPVTLAVGLEGSDRPDASVEAAAYFVVCETLTNVAKHARAGSAAVRVDASGVGDERVLSVEVRDDGVGGADLAKGHGLAGLVDRVEGLGGLLSVTSPEGGPTVVRATLPWGRD